MYIILYCVLFCMQGLMAVVSVCYQQVGLTTVVTVKPHYYIHNRLKYEVQVSPFRLSSKVSEQIHLYQKCLYTRKCCVCVLPFRHFLTSPMRTCILCQLCNRTHRQLLSTGNSLAASTPCRLSACLPVGTCSPGPSLCP